MSIRMLSVDVHCPALAEVYLTWTVDTGPVTWDNNIDTTTTTLVVVVVAVVLPPRDIVTS